MINSVEMEEGERMLTSWGEKTTVKWPGKERHGKLRVKVV